MFKKVYSLYSTYSAFCTQPSFYSQSAVCILHSVCSLPLVRSLQSAVRSLRFTLTCFLSSHFDAFLFRQTLSILLHQAPYVCSNRFNRQNRAAGESDQLNVRFEEQVCFQLTVSLFSRFDNFEECCNSIYGTFNGNQWRKIKLGSFASIWKKDQSTDLESGKKSSHKEGAHGGKLTVRKTC